MSGLVFYTLLFTFILIGRWLRSRRKSLLDLRVAWSIFLFGMALNSTAFLIGDFYIEIESLRLVWTKIGYISLTLALAAFFLAVERIMTYNTRHSFSIPCIVISSLTIFSTREYLVFFALSASVVAFIGIFVFFNYAQKKTSGEIKNGINVMIAGFLVGFAGFITRSETIFYLFGELIHLAGSFLLIVGIGALGLAIVFTPILEELDWRKQLVRLYVIETGGVLVYNHRFSETDLHNDFLTAAGFSGVQSLMQEITASEEGLNMLSIGEMEILFSHGDEFISVLIAKRPYQILLDKVAEFKNEFQATLGNMIGSYGGDITIFNSAHQIVEGIF
jgi:hypothetical protein